MRWYMRAQVKGFQRTEALRDAVDGFETPDGKRRIGRLRAFRR